MSELEVRRSSRDLTSGLLGKMLANLAEGITGLAASERKDLILSLGHVFQRLRSGEFLKNLKIEWDAFREKGRVKDDYIDLHR